MSCLGASQSFRGTSSSLPPRSRRSSRGFGGSPVDLRKPATKNRNEDAVHKPTEPRLLRRRRRVIPPLRRGEQRPTAPEIDASAAHGFRGTGEFKGRETMSTVLDHLAELDLLVRAARSTGIQPEKFAAGMRDAMQKISTLLAKNPPSGFLDADSALSEALEDYEKHPGLAGVGKIGNALVGYRRTATS
jgi:hypothetical protein